MADLTKTFENSGMAIEWFHIPSADLKNTELSTVRFKAFLTQFAEQYNSDWNQETVYGRMDPIESFRGSRRSISLAWTVISHDNDEAFENLKKVSKLLQFLYPSYSMQSKTYNESGFGVISAAPLLRLKFMNLIQATRDKGVSEFANKFAQSNAAGSMQSFGSVATGGLVGRTGGFNVVHELNEGTAMIAGPVAAPKRISISCTFYPIHEHGLGWDSETRKFLSPEWPYGLSDSFPSTGGGNEVDQTGGAGLSETGDQDTHNLNIVGGG